LCQERGADDQGALLDADGVDFNVVAPLRFYKSFQTAGNVKPNLLYKTISPFIERLLYIICLFLTNLLCCMCFSCGFSDGLRGFTAV
jgi:hypothetical protein